MSDTRWLIIPDDRRIKRTPGDGGEVWTFGGFASSVVLQDVRFGKGGGIRAGVRLDELLHAARAGDTVSMRAEDWKLLRDAFADPTFPGGGGYVPSVARSVIAWIDYVADRAMEAEPKQSA